MRSYRIIFCEFLLIFASVLIFRSFWMLLDRITLMNLEFGIWASLIVGVFITAMALLMLNKYVDEKTKK
jgi:hypothetical protein